MSVRPVGLKKKFALRWPACHHPVHRDRANGQRGANF
jgi:hypothetical protein